MIGNVHDVPIILGSRSDIETEKERKMSETNLHLLKVVHFQIICWFMFRRYDEALILTMPSLPCRSALLLISHLRKRRDLDLE